MKKPKALAILCVLLCLTMISADALPLLASCRTQTISAEKENANGEYVVSVFKHGQWQEAGRLGYDMFLKEKSLDLSVWLAENSSAAVKISQEGGEAAHLDSVLLGGEAPQSVNFDDGILLIKLSKKDLDLTNVDTDGIDLLFPANRSNDVLTVTGRIEGKNISKEPFKFPSENNYKEINKYSKFYSYRLDSVSRTLTVDGNLEEIEGLKPLFKEYCRPGTGHPEGFTYGWIMNDEDYLYAVVDFTPDNTMDGDKDYSKLYIKTNDTIREFKVSVPETNWGQPAFTYTDKVGYQHKAYEFKIPIEEIAEAGRSDIELAFSAYGTAGIYAIHPSVAYSSFNDKYLLVYESYYGSILYGQFVDSDASYDGDPFVIVEPAEDTWSLNFSPEVVYDEDHNQFLVVWKSCNSSGTGHIKGRLIEYRNDSAHVLRTAFNICELKSGFSNTHDSPSAAYNDAANKFLVAWTDYDGETSPILGRLISWDGECFGDNNLIIRDNSNATAAVSVASGSGSNFVAVYTDYTDGKEIIYSKVITADGAGTVHEESKQELCESEVILSSPHICFNESSGLYFATWIENNHIIGGLYLNTDGSISDSYLELVSDSDTDCRNSSTIYNNQSDTYLSVWDGVDFREDDVAFGQLFDEDLGEQGGIISFGDEEMYPPEFIDSAANTNAGNFLVAYSSYYSSDKVYVELVGGTAGYEPMESINPALAYNPDENNYLLVYTNQEYNGPSLYKSEAMENPSGETSHANDIGIVGQFISSTAEAQGRPFLISEALSEDRDPDTIDYPDVACGDNMYLVVWAEREWLFGSELERRVMGNILNESGNSLTEGAFPIATINGYIEEVYPSVAYGEGGKFLVVWSSESGSSNDILGRIVSFDSNKKTPLYISPENIEICTDESTQEQPSVSYSEDLEKFLVAWRDFRGDINDQGSDIYGLLLHKDGTIDTESGEIPICTAEMNQMEPSVAYYESGKFVVTWCGEDENDDILIYGKFLDVSKLTDQESEKLIISRPDGPDWVWCSNLSTVYNAIGKEFFSVWSASLPSSSGNWYETSGAGQHISNTLVPSGNSYDFGESIYNVDDPRLDTACNTIEGNYLVAYPCGGRYYEEYSSGKFSSEYSDNKRKAYIKWELIGEAHENPGIIQFKDADYIEGYDRVEGDCIYYNVDEDHGILGIPVERSEGFSGDVTVTYAVYGNAENPWDYEILEDYPVFSGSESEDIIEISIKDDNEIDPGEYIQLEIYDAEDAELGEIIKARIHIIDNDSASVRFSSSSYTVAENVYAETGANYAEIKVVFSGFQPIYEYSPLSSYEGQDGDTVFSVVYDTFDGTASEGEDYTGVSGLLHFGYEAEERTFRIPIIDDNKDEANETVNLSLSFPEQVAYRSGSVEGDTMWIGDYPVTLGTPKTATLTITDDDTAPSKPKDKKDKKKATVVEPARETPPPVEELPDDALVDRMPGYIVLGTPVKMNTVKEVISLSYNKDTLADSPGHDARIYYWNPEVSKWVALATYPDGSGKVKAINDGGYKGWFVVFGVIQPHFADINSHWAEQLINRMNGLGLIEGYALKDSDMRLARPEQKVTRAEFTMFVTRIMNMNPDNILLPDIPDSEAESILAGSYTDASEISPWVRTAAAKAVKAGLVPFEGSSFKPLEPITRIEAAVMVSRALKKFKDFKTVDLNSFKDSDAIPGWASGQVVENVLEGYPDNTLKPNNDMARAESLAMLMRLFIKGLGW